MVHERPRVVTASDVADDVRSLQRKLDRKLLLLVKQKLGIGEYWCMPMGIHTEDETMRKVKFHSIYVHSVMILHCSSCCCFVKKLG